MVSNEPACEGGRLLICALNERGLTLERGEKEAGVSAGYFSRLLAGPDSRPMTRLDIARQIERALGVPVGAWGQPLTVESGERQTSDRSPAEQEKGAHTMTRANKRSRVCAGSVEGAGEVTS